MRTPIRITTLLVVGLLASSLGLQAPAQAAYAGDNGRIAFMRANQIYTIKPDGTGLIQLTRAAKNSRPKWSPDGRRIAYLHETAAGTDLWVMRSDGSDKQRVTRLGNVQGPSWSPDGKWLAFGSPLQRVRSTAPFGTPEILGARSDTCCSDEPWSVIGQVAWSADGDHIAFASDDYPSSPDHYFLEYSVSRHVVTAVTATGGACCGEGWFADPFYGPDGSGPGFTTKVDPFDGQAGTPARLGYRPDGRRAFPARAYDQQGAPSPSGKRIAFMNNATGTRYVYVANLDGSARKRLTPGSQPDWRPIRTVRWAPPPPPTRDLLRPILTLDPWLLVEGQTVGASNVLDTDDTNDFTDIPARFTWKGFDPESEICGYDVDRTPYGEPAERLFTGTTTTTIDGMTSNHRFEPGAVSYEVTARDCAGNSTQGGWYPMAMVVDDSGLGPDATSENAPTFTGSWDVSTFSGWSGGSTHKTTEAGASASFSSFLWGSIGVVMATGPDRGVATIQLDGQTVDTVDTYSETRQSRVLVSVFDLADAGDHTVTVVNEGTADRPRIDLDAFILTW